MIAYCHMHGSFDTDHHTECPQAGEDYHSDWCDECCQCVDDDGRGHEETCSRYGIAPITRSCDLPSWEGEPSVTLRRKNSGT